MESRTAVAKLQTWSENNFRITYDLDINLVDILNKTNYPIEGMMYSWPYLEFCYANKLCALDSFQFYTYNICFF